MKNYIMAVLVASLCAACDQKPDATPAKETTVVTPATGETKETNNNTVVTPPATETKENNTTVVTPPPSEAKPDAPAPAPSTTESTSTTTTETK